MLLVQWTIRWSFLSGYAMTREQGILLGEGVINRHRSFGSLNLMDPH